MSLREELREIFKRAPDLIKFDGWIPVGIDNGLVQARKEKDDKILIMTFKPEGVWKEVYDWLKERDELLDIWEAVLAKEHNMEIAGEDEEEGLEEKIDKVKFEGYEGKWVTLENGQHVFIREGETISDAIGRLKPKAPRALMDYDRRVNLRLNRKDPDVTYIYDKAVDIKDINLPEPRSEYRLKDNKEKIGRTKAVPPILLVFDPDTQRFDIEDGVHRTNAVKDLGYKAIPAVITYHKDF